MAFDQVCIIGTEEVDAVLLKPESTSRACFVPVAGVSLLVFDLAV